jgi:hypothetical protein
MSENRIRVGVAAADPLLSLGLIGILEESFPVEALALSAGELLAAHGDAGGLTAVILALGPAALPPLGSSSASGQPEAHGPGSSSRRCAAR